MKTIKNLQSCEDYRSAKDILRDQKKLTNKDIPPILPKFFKENGNWAVSYTHLTLPTKA